MQSRLDNSAIESYNEDMVNESVHEALDSLPEMYRQVLSLRYFGGMTISEISEFLGIPRRTIDRRIRDAQSRLREEITTMIDISKEQRDLPAGFTFRIVEIVKGIRINPISPIKSLPLGLSVAIGIIVGILSIGTNLNFIESVGTFTGSLSESKALSVGEFPVDVVKVSDEYNISGQVAGGNGLGFIVPSLQNALFMAPQAEGGKWTKKADMPTARCQLSTSTVNGKIYAIGGGNHNGYTPATEEYDLAIDKWVKKKDMPTKRGFFATGVIGDKIYAIGGSPDLGATKFPIVEEYDPMLDKWTRKADILPARWASPTSEINGKIYVIGGESSENFEALKTIEEYDPKTGESVNFKGRLPTTWDDMKLANNR